MDTTKLKSKLEKQRDAKRKTRSHTLSSVVKEIKKLRDWYFDQIGKNTPVNTGRINVDTPEVKQIIEKLKILEPKIQRIKSIDTRGLKDPDFEFLEKAAKSVFPARNKKKFPPDNKTKAKLQRLANKPQLDRVCMYGNLYYSINHALDNTDSYNIDPANGKSALQGNQKHPFIQYAPGGAKFDIDCLHTKRPNF